MYYKNRDSKSADDDTDVVESFKLFADSSDAASASDHNTTMTEYIVRAVVLVCIIILLVLAFHMLRKLLQNH